ncbi:polysaccharide deacetylase [Fundidesulfovibrio agrisoli]|uniref:polysaccharide deacetylase n=1 Tax=Fundidesulfovibrio agrisoli TaxID=2922717 RepID=UPI001FAB7299|nr:polysaccharide deacetylase [Fundidesulfovibrio agrisoli]
MIVSNNVSPIWLAIPDNYRTRLIQAAELGLSQAPGGRAQVFFRADDVAVPGNSFTKMVGIFREGGAPLCMATVPSWLTVSRWQALLKEAREDELFCWCQHGWRHMNFEPVGQKKREFGQARPAKDKRLDLTKGFKRLGEIMEQRFTPVFSPPWNRCDGESMAAMPAIGFRGLSRTVGAGPNPPENLPDFPVRMDLHTRKEPDPQASLEAMLDEMRQGLASGRLGVMLHHQRMNDAAGVFLAALIKELGALKVDFTDFRRLLAAS